MPQAGDIMVLRRQKNPDKSKVLDNSFTNKKYQSHTSLIEKVENHKLHTIEGNKGNKVTGRIFDLTNAEDVREIIYIARPDLQNILGESKKPIENALESSAIGESLGLYAESREHIGEEELLKPLKKIVILLKKRAVKQGAVKSADSVAEMTKASGGGDS